MRLLSCFLLLSLWHASDAQASKVYCDEFLCVRQKVLLFAIKANIGKSAITEYSNRTAVGYTPSYPDIKDGGILPEVFRSPLLDNLPEAIKQTGSRAIVTEMYKDDRPVARAVFDATVNVDNLDSHNWFMANRLLETFPYETGNKPESFVDMSIKGHKYKSDKNIRSFYIHHSHGGCNVDQGLMGIGEGNDECGWSNKGGKPPVLFYSKYKGNYEHVVDYADIFLVYLTT